jgi:hypothetical protein
MTRDDVLHEDDPRTSLTGEKKLNAILNSLSAGGNIFLPGDGEGLPRDPQGQLRPRAA